MRYLPLTDEEKKRILSICGASTFEELTSQIPEKLRLKRPLNIGPGLSEWELTEHIGELAKKNKAAGMLSFLGQGLYDHSWPSTIDQLTNRGEFLTAYTPYQPELAQGTLINIFEFQSMIAELFGMEVANASLYDGSTAAVEALLMAARLAGKNSGTVFVSEGTYDQSLSIIRNYLRPLGFEVKIWKADPNSHLSTQHTYKPAQGEAVAFLLQSPNKWGLVEDWEELKKVSELNNARSVAYVSHAHSLALYNPPGDFNIDIAAGEGQSLGIPVGFGGPLLGLFACSKKNVRQMPGRLVGESLDRKGQRAFCVTLSTREQHIRRSKATSNICSNQNLMALRASMFLTLMGPEGMKKLAELSYSKAEYLRDLLSQSDLSHVDVLKGESFNEVALLLPQRVYEHWSEIERRLMESGMLPGVLIPSLRADLPWALMMAVTEKHSQKNLDQFASKLKEILKGVL